jgi:hypothetical protein
VACEKSAPSWTSSLEPAALTNGLLTESYRVEASLPVPTLPTIARADVGMSRTSCERNSTILASFVRACFRATDIPESSLSPGKAEHSKPPTPGFL